MSETISELETSLQNCQEKRDFWKERCLLAEDKINDLESKLIEMTENRDYYHKQFMRLQGE